MHHVKLKHWSHAHLRVECVCQQLESRQSGGGVGNTVVQLVKEVLYHGTGSKDILRQGVTYYTLALML